MTAETCYMLGKNFSRHFETFFFIFLENWIRYFMQTVSLCMKCQSYFLGKIRKTSVCSLMNLPIAWYYFAHLLKEQEAVTPSPYQQTANSRNNSDTLIVCPWTYVAGTCHGSYNEYQQHMFSYAIRNIYNTWKSSY